MKRSKQVVDATSKETSREQDFFFPIEWVTIKAKSFEEAKKKLKNIS